MRYNLIKFDDGTFGVLQINWLGKRFVDLHCEVFVNTSEYSTGFNFRGTEEQARQVVKALTNKDYRIIKP